MKRTDYCGELGEKDVGREICVCGWVQAKRDMGGVIFIDLKDREGILQVVFNSGVIPQEGFAIGEGLRNQTVISVCGNIRLRDGETINPRIETGTVELLAKNVRVLSEADPLPFPIEDETQVREELRLKHRFLDLRRPKMLMNLRFRHKVQKAVQDYLDADGFIAVETPILTKSTPEGARDYLVPSRVHPGTFYALPQSPQIFKQLLMVGGIDKYYQVARCFRDEDLRSDRQPEFTQVDMEMSFAGQEEILLHLERLFKHIFREAMGLEFPEPFPRMTWREAMDVYGSDKPDLRFSLPIADITPIAGKCGFSVFREAVEKGGVVRAINVKGGADFTRSDIEVLTRRAMGYGAKGMAWIMIRPDGELYSVLTKYFSQGELSGIMEAAGAEKGDFILFCADSLPVVRRTLGGLRCDIAKMRNLIRDGFSFLIVTDFPQFEYSEAEGRWVAMHHPFTMPYPEDMEYFESDPGRVRAQSYDVVLNGVELGSGSIRIHRRDVQQRMFEALGFSEEEIQRRFGFMLGAFKYGTPPHGGFAFGLDRLVMLMLGAESLRDVVAFPKARDASCPMTSAPDFVDAEQLEVLSLLCGAAVEKAASMESAKKIDVEKVAGLAYLYIAEEERERIAGDMGAVIKFANRLQKADTEGIPATAHAAPLKNIMREDELWPSFDRGTMLSNAKTKDGEYIIVPKVIDEGGAE